MSVHLRCEIIEGAFGGSDLIRAGGGGAAVLQVGMSLTNDVLTVIE